MNWKLYWELFSTWFRIGLFTFGGGYAMLPLIEKEVIEKKGWTNQEEILDIFAIAQSIPGAIAINSAVFLGRRLGGVHGAIVSAIGIVLPSLLVILTIAMFFVSFLENHIVMKAFSGIRAAIVGLVAAAALNIALSSSKNNPAVAIVIISTLVNLFTEINAVVVILLGALSGIIIYYLIPKLSYNKGEGKS